MTLPPLPEPDTHGFDDDTGLDVWSHSPDQMRAYGKACAAAERERWRKADGYAIVVHPENTAMLNMLPDGQWVILRRKCVPSHGECVLRSTKRGPKARTHYSQPDTQIL